MCKIIHIIKYCIGCGSKNEWAIYKKQNCPCGISTPEDLYRHPYPYAMFRCDLCTQNDIYFENSARGKVWVRKTGADLRNEETKKKRGSGRGK